MIDWDAGVSPIGQSKLTLISFSHAQMVGSDAEEDCHLTRSTKDLSDLCAVLFWLLTDSDPEQRENDLPRMIEKAVQAANSRQSSRLKTYLTDTFSRAFSQPTYQPWTLADFEVRLEAIHELIAATNNYATCDDVLADLLKIPKNIAVGKTSSLLMDDCYRKALEKAARIIEKNKQSFVEHHQDMYEWFDGSCMWVDESHSSIIECLHDDILTLSRRQGRSIAQCPFNISFFACLNKADKTMTLSIGTTYNGRRLQIPIICDRMDADYENQFQETFADELKSLLIALCKEQKLLSYSEEIDTVFQRSSLFFPS